MKAKKLLALLLTVLLALSLSATAFASDPTNTPETTTEKGSITITNAANGKSYTIYKVFDLTYGGTGETGGSNGSEDDPENLYTPVSYTYTKTGDNDALYAALTGENSPFTLTASVKENVYTVSLKDESTTGEDIATFLKGLVDAGTLTTTIGSKEASSNGELKFENLDLGYYYIASTMGASVTIDSTMPNVEVVDKNVLPQISKQVQEDSNDSWGTTNTADIGDTVNFQVTITTEGTPKDYVLHDTMGTGLTFGNVTGITWTKSGTTTVKTLTENTDYTVTNPSSGDGCAFEITFDNTFLEQVGAYDTIVVSYTATVNSSAVIEDAGNTNEATLNYKDANGGDGDPRTDTTTTYVYDVDILKYTGTEKTPLSGAEFVLYKTVKESVETEGEEPTETNTNYYAKVTDGKLTGWTTTESEATTLTSGTDGKISVDGLDADTYYLKETKAPNGYNLLNDPVEFKIDDEGNVSVKSGDTYQTATDGQIDVENQTGTELPSTGGVGTTIFYVVGSVLVIGAVVLLIVKKRMNGSEE